MVVLKIRSDMLSSLGPKIKMVPIFLFLRFGTQFSACEPQMYVILRGNYKQWPNMVLTIISIGCLVQAESAHPRESQIFQTPWLIGLSPSVFIIIYSHSDVCPKILIKFIRPELIGQFGHV